MFDTVADETLRAAHDAARLLYDNHRALGLDPSAIKLTRCARTSPWNSKTGASRPAKPTVGDAPPGQGNE